MDRTCETRCLLVMLLVVPLSVSAADKEIVLDHSKGSAAVRMDAQPGDHLTFKVVNTCSAVFSYDVEALPGQVDDPGVSNDGDSRCHDANTLDQWLVDKGFCRLDTKTLTSVFASDIGSYVVTAKGTYPDTNEKKVFQGVTASQLQSAPFDKNSGTAEVCENVLNDWKNTEDALTVSDAKFSVDAQRIWALGMSGGLTASFLVDPRFAIVPNASSMGMPPENIVVRDSRAEDSAALGFAGFVHLHNRKLKFWNIGVAPTLGLGIGDQNSINAFAGVSFAAGDLGYITLGYNWRQVDRLPAGQQRDQAPLNDNVLSELPTRIDGGMFLGFSFKFMSPGESFFKNRTVKPTVEVSDG